MDRLIGTATEGGRFLIVRFGLLLLLVDARCVFVGEITPRLGYLKERRPGSASSAAISTAIWAYIR